MLGLDIGCGGYCRLQVCLDIDFSYNGTRHLDYYIPIITDSHVYIRGDAHSLPFSDNTFDIVYIIHALEHFKCPYIALLEAFRVLRPQGLLLVIVPNPKVNLADWRDRTHLYSFTEASLENLLEAIGFEHIATTTIYYNEDIMAQAIKPRKAPNRGYKALDSPHGLLCLS